MVSDRGTGIDWWISDRDIGDEQFLELITALFHRMMLWITFLAHIAWVGMVGVFLHSKLRDEKSMYTREVWVET